MTRVRRFLGRVAMFAAAWCVGWVTGAVGFAAWVGWRYKRGWK